ncbi:MAG: hypothetical protein ACFUZC_11010 [Chthoniobacteraceae bacterium]
MKIIPFPIHRGVRIALASLLMGTPAFLCAQTLKQPGVVLSVESWNDIRIQDESGNMLLKLTGIRTSWIPRNGSVREITADGNSAIEVVYDLAGADKGSQPHLTARLIPYPGRIAVHYELSGVPDGAKINGIMFRRGLANAAEDLPVAKLGLWQRHAYGGQPIEIPDGKLLPCRVGKHLVSLAADGGNSINIHAKDPNSYHAGLVKSATIAGTYTADFSVLVTPVNWSSEVIAARWHQRPLGLHIGTDHTYNWWTDAASPFSLNALLVNVSAEDRTVEFRYWVRDFSGKFLSQQTREVSLKSGQSLAEDIRFQPVEIRGIYFAEVAAIDKKTGTEVFARTNLTLLPDHQFKATSADSIFGIAAYWPFPTENGVQRVMDRMGVRWYRQGNTHSFKNITALHHSHIPKLEEKAKRDAWIREQLQICVDSGNPAWEFGNEINYGVLSIGMGDVLKDEARAKRIETYVQWVRDIRRVQKEMGAPATNVNILSVGLAGMDVKFADGIQAAGGWELLDGLAIHPGRGNFTADYPVSTPWKEWQTGAYGNYWNFYGSVRTGANLVKKYGKPGEPKDLWLTEVYTCSFPNSFWEDSLRNGTENVVLSFALAKAEGVKAVMWYQLFDSVWSDKLGVNPKDREYYFGLIQRDLSFKPALLAYATIAEELDQARFVRWLNFPALSKSRGLLFDTPRGPMAVLWDRTDGFILNKRKADSAEIKADPAGTKPPFASPEAWIDNWQSHIKVSLPVADKALTTINPIGQRETVPANDHSATLTLTGAPVIVYGLDAERLK